MTECKGRGGWGVENAFAGSQIAKERYAKRGCVTIVLMCTGMMHSLCPFYETYIDRNVL